MHRSVGANPNNIKRATAVPTSVSDFAGPAAAAFETQEW
jgi:hypothetical protein